MFYSQFILAKKGPLGTIWIAAHLERKLRKNQVTETNIGVSVDSILFPEVPIALRLSGHLLLGVVRIYSRKVNYLFHDCSEALVKIKQAFHSAAVDLPPEAATAPFHSITLPENFDLDDLELLPDREALFLASNSIDHHVTSREQITLQDTIDDSTYLGSQFGLDERFPDGNAPRLVFDEDVLPVKFHEQEDHAILEEDSLPSLENNDDQLEEEGDKAEDDLALEVTGEQMPDLNEEDDSAPEVTGEQMPDLNEDHPSKCSEAQVSESSQAITAPGNTSDALDMNMAPDAEDAIEPSAHAMETADKEVEEQGAAVVPGDDSAETKPPPEETQEDGKDGEADLPAVEQEELAVAALEDTTEAVRDENDKNGGLEDMHVVVDMNTENTDRKTLEAGNIGGRLEETEVEISEEVPEIEKVRSAAEVNPELALELGGIPDSAEKVDDRHSSLEEDALKISPDAEETPILKQDAPSASPPSMTTLPDFAADDDDLLASILGRRSLKVAPTPDVPPAKRQKTGSKPASKKRKIQLDEAMVLHGDDMRQQLSDTSGIRRVRKRAPCTEYEAWNSEKEARGHHMFDEPLVLGFGDHIRELYHCIYAVGDAKLPLASEEVAAKQKHHLLDYEETTEAITLEDEPYDDYDLYDVRRAYLFEEKLEEQDSKTCEVEATGVEETVPIDLVPQPVEAPSDDKQEESEPAEVQTNKQEENQPVELKTSPPTGEHASSVEAPVAEEAAATINIPDEEIPSQAGDDIRSLDSERPASNAEEDLEAEASKSQSINDVEPDVAAVEASEKPEAEERVDQTAADDKTVVENSVLFETDEAVPVDIARIQCEDQPVSPEDDHDNEAVQALGFLVDAKDEEAADDCEADYGEAQIQDNSGWSVRTRAVCQYLQMTFKSMDGSIKDKRKLGLERLLQGKTRRESARMFFESLVLKTKDYINVEQTAPYENIYISARAKLMKADI